MPDRVIIVHYHEIALKGGNRAWFERQLLENVSRALRGVKHAGVRRISGRLLVQLQSDTPVPLVIDRLRHVFGIVHFAEAVAVAQDVDTITSTAWNLVENHTFSSFRVTTRRSNKAFPLSSVELNTQVGGYIKERSGARVDLKHPDLTCSIEIVDKSALISAGRTKGAGGLPVGVGETAAVLLSSGIDSPVASYRIMKRGVRLVFIHFHSAPFTSKSSQRNTERIVDTLSRYQFDSILYLVPIIDVQQAITVVSPASFRVVLYRRAMVRAATMIARSEGAVALVTGENVGQVASQTLSNIAAIEEATSLPILRPLAGHDKSEIIEEAQGIGTYEISIEPYEDCCSLFVPKHPETRADLDEIRSIESRVELDSLLQKAISDAERKVVEWTP